MKKRDLADIKNKNIKELKAEANRLEKELANLKLEIALGKVKNTSTAKGIKKSIAQVKTILRFKELAAQITKKEEVEANDGKK